MPEANMLILFGSALCNSSVIRRMKKHEICRICRVEHLLLEIVRKPIFENIPILNFATRIISSYCTMRKHLLKERAGVICIADRKIAVHDRREEFLLLLSYY